MKKIIFLDIDGTLVDFDQKMPESTLRALKEAKAKGHYLVICTGRAHSIIYDWLFDMDFDGIIASAGANIFWQGEKIYHSCIPKEELTKLVEVLQRHNATYMVQGFNGQFIDADNKKRFEEMLLKQGIDVKKLGFLKQTVIEKPYDRDDIESGVFHNADVSFQEIQKEIGDSIKLTAASFENEEAVNNAEFTKAGVSKATGIEFLIQHLGLAHEDTIAFGDSANDVEMIAYANTGVAMGNGIPEVKVVADLVTDELKNDGIYNGFKKLGLID